MSDFLPVYEDADRLSYTAGAAITGGQVVEFTAADVVSPTGGVSNKVAGIALMDAATGQQVTVTRTGVAELVTTANVAVGDAIGSSTAGGVATVVSPTNPFGVIGLATRAATAPAAVRVQLRLQ
jgi:hypothetical protein